MVRGSTNPLPPAPDVLPVGMTEYRFDVPAVIQAGRTVFRVANTGTLDHSLTLAVLPADMPPLDEQLKGDVRRGVTTLAALPTDKPGQKATFALDLPPGRYGLICFVQDPDGVQHAKMGMNAEFRVS